MPKHPTITFTLRRKKGNPIASVAASVSAYKERELWTLDIRIPIECWDEHQRRVVHRKGLVAAGEAHSYNMMIANTRDQFNRVMMHMHLRGEQPTKDAIIRRMALADLGHDFHRWAEARIVELTGIHSPATIRHYRCTFTAMREFMPRMSYADLTCDMVERFDHWLIRNRGLTANSRAKYHKHLKTFSRVLAHDVPGIPDIYARHRIKQTPGKREFLNRMEVNVLERAYSEGDLSPHLMQSLGMFLFSCHTGLRFSDLMHIAWEHVRENYLMFRPQKTRHLDKRIDVPLATTALSYPHYPVGKLFSPISNMQYNRNLKEMAAALGIRKNLSAHVGRHTFATGYLNNGGNIHVLQRILGHADLSTTEVYVHVCRLRIEEERGVVDTMFSKKQAPLPSERQGGYA